MNFCFRPAFAPLYGNQYSSQQSNQTWSNSGSQYHSIASGNNASSGLTTATINKRGNADIDSNLANNNRKEKRQYKKRKHKNQRDKPPYSTPGHFTKQKFIRILQFHLRTANTNLSYLFSLFYIQICLGPPIDPMASSDEDEPVANNNNHLGHETEEECLFPFRRNNTNQYHRVCLFA